MTSLIFPKGTHAHTHTKTLSIKLPQYFATLKLRSTQAGSVIKVTMNLKLISYTVLFFTELMPFIRHSTLKLPLQFTQNISRKNAQKHIITDKKNTAVASRR